MVTINTFNHMFLEIVHELMNPNHIKLEDEIRSPRWNMTKFGSVLQGDKSLVVPYFVTFSVACYNQLTTPPLERIVPQVTATVYEW